MGLKKLKTDSVLKFNEKVTITGFHLVLPSGNDVEYTPDDPDDSYFYSVNVQSSDLNYDSLDICADFMETAVNADEKDFEAAVSDLRELRKAHNNFKIKLGII